MEVTESLKSLEASMHVSVCLSQAVDAVDTMSSASVGISDLSDEILLCILRHVPVCDLVTNVARVCNRFHTLCHDKSLLSNVNLSEDYLVNLLEKTGLSDQMKTVYYHEHGEMYFSPTGK